MTDPRPSTLVVALGNPILGDDGVGWHVLDALRDRLGPDAGIELDRLSVGGVALMERLVGYRRAVIVDAILGDADPPGTTWCRPIDAVVTRTASHLDSSHDAPLPAALLAGRALGARLPEQILVVGVAIARADVFGESLSQPVAAAVGGAVTAVLEAVTADQAADLARPV